MKKLLLIIIIIGALIVSGCSENSDKVTLEKTVDPKYQAGDIVYNKLTIEDGLWLILNYNPESDQYETDIIFKNEDGTWGYRINDDFDTEDRLFFENSYPVLIDHVDPTQITIGETFSSETQQTTGVSPRYERGDILWDSPNTDMAWLVLDYLPDIDQYKLDTVQIYDEKWYYFEENGGAYYPRDIIEEDFQYKLTNIKPEDIPMFELSTS